MKHGYRNVGKWALRGALVVLVLFGLYVTTLAFPFPLFEHKQSFGEFTVYSNLPLPDDFDQVTENARVRIEAMENARPNESYRVFICGNQRLYSFFASLTRRSSDSMGIGLAAFGNIYLNEAKIQRVAAQNYGDIRHSRFEGDFAEAIAHEIAHFNVVKALGYRAAIRMPFWKSEGYAEYQANLAATRADSSYNFTDRIELVMNDAFWGRSTIARSLFEWHLLVEFLAEERGFGLVALVEEPITEASARNEMFAWYERQLTTQ